MTFPFFALGGFLLIWVLHEIPQKVILDNDGIRLRSGWRGGYLQWSRVEEATLSRGNKDIRLRGNGKSLSFCFGRFPVRQREPFAKALQYYLIKYGVPTHRRDWLLP